MSQVIKTIVECVHEDVDLAGVKFDIGRLKRKRNIRPPHVTWIPTSATFEPPDDPGGRMNDAGDARSKQSLTRVQAFEVRIRHCDIAATEGLVDDVAKAAQAAAFGSVAFGAATWITQTADGADFAIDGEEVALELTFRVPVLEEVAALAIITSATHDGKFTSFITGQEETGCP